MEGCSKSTEDIYNPVPDYTEVPLELLLEVKTKLESFLPRNLIAIANRDGISVCVISPHNNMSIQRNVVFYPNGGVELFVHRQSMCVNQFLCHADPPVPLESDSVNYFVGRAITIVNKVRDMEICSGFDVEKYKPVWSNCPFGKIDENPYDESRYIETLRSTSCKRLVNSRKWRCSECSKLFHPLRRRLNSSAVEDPHTKTNNQYLSEVQKLKKLQDQRRELNNTKKQLARLREKMQELLEKQGVQVDPAMSDDLTNILKDGDLSPAQSIFLQEQIKASQKKNMVGVRWHPTMIRLALALHLTSPAAYELLRDTGMVKLPTSRTLFDYSHARPVEDGIDKVVLDSIADRVIKFPKHRRYHILMADEMHISQNLVFQKSTGRLIGYTKLDDLDKEVQVLNKHLDNPDEELQEIIASKVLVYMVKGISVGIKEVIASYPVANPSASQMYMWTWQVIGALERSGVPIIAFVCDGFSTNRAFIRMHKPATPTASGVIFDTINKAARGRKLFFISDVPHLLKTLRNCFMNSRWDNKKSRRHMMYRGKKISWDFLIKLYESQKGKSLRKSFKLNAMNVYPDSYARMKVRYAGEAVSKTVAMDLISQNWEDAEETIAFILMFNRWFDCLNGAHSNMAKRRKNTDLSAYTKEVLGVNPKDKRFKFLDSVLEHLRMWKEEALNQNSNVTVNTSTTADTPRDFDESEIFEGEIETEEDDTPGSRRILSRETLEGIEMSTLAIKSAITFLLEEGVSYINPRVFTQDPLEQHFSKIRAGQGGSNNPNYWQVQNRNRAIHTIGQLGMKKRKGNSMECAVTVEVTSEPLLKRQSHRASKFVL